MRKEVQDYIASIPKDRINRFMSIHNLVEKLYPDTIIDMSYRMPTYKIGDGWIALANQKNYISLYTCGASHIESYMQKHPQQKTGRGCINFRERDEIHYGDLEAVIKHAMEYPKT